MEQVIGQEITEQDRELAQKFVECSIGNYARQAQRGPAAWFGKLICGRCPSRMAYDKVYGGRVREKAN